MEIDLRELSFAIDFLAVDTHDPQLGAQQGGDAEVRRAVHPGLEEEGTVALEQPLDGPPCFGIGEVRAPLDIAGAARGGEGSLDDPGRRSFAEDAIKVR